MILRSIVIGILVIALPNVSLAQSVGACDPRWQKAITQAAVDGMKMDIGRGWSTGLKNSESVTQISCFSASMDSLRSVNVLFDPAKALTWLINKVCAYMQEKINETSNFDENNFWDRIPNIPGVVVDRGYGTDSATGGVVIPDMGTVGGGVNLDTGAINLNRGAAQSSGTSSGGTPSWSPFK